MILLVIMEKLLKNTENFMYAKSIFFKSKTRHFRYVLSLIHKTKKNVYGNVK